MSKTHNSTTKISKMNKTLMLVLCRESRKTVHGRKMFGCFELHLAFVVAYSL